VCDAQRHCDAEKSDFFGPEHEDEERDRPEHE